MTRFAIVGCGYVADMYVATLANHAGLELAGVFDRDPERSRRFARYYGLSAYSCLDEVLGDGSVPLVANLTNPRSHYAVSRAALEAGKHVYSEKPLATTMADACELVEIAERRGLCLASAPCNLLGESIQTLWKALRDGRIGTPRGVYAELDGDICYRDYRAWASESGTPWPFEDELTTGCTMEHAGYHLGWLTAVFGPATRLVATASAALADAVDGGEYAPTCTVGCIHFASGPLARITCSTVTSSDNGIRIFGDEGILSTPDCWDYGSPVYFETRRPRSWRERHPRRAQLLGLRPSIPLVRPSVFEYSRRSLRMDYSRGIAELADAIAERREPRLSARWSLHVTELVLAMAAGEGAERRLNSTFRSVAPMPWAA